MASGAHAGWPNRLVRPGSKAHEFRHRHHQFAGLKNCVARMRDLGFGLSDFPSHAGNKCGGTFRHHLHAGFKFLSRGQHFRCRSTVSACKRAWMARRCHRLSLPGAKSGCGASTIDSSQEDPYLDDATAFRHTKAPGFPLCRKRAGTSCRASFLDPMPREVRAHDAWRQ